LRLHREGTARTRQFRIGGERGLTVAGHLDLGHHVDAAGLGVGHDFAHVVRRVEAAVATASRLLVAPGAHLRQPRQARHFQAPALVLGQVPVQDVEAVERQPIDDAQHGLHRLEVATAVQQQSTPGEGGPVVDGPARPPVVTVGGAELEKRRQSVREAGAIRRPQLQSEGRDQESVALGRKVGVRGQAQFG
jgi:hypothetical protein